MLLVALSSEVEGALEVPTITNPKDPAGGELEGYASSSFEYKFDFDGNVFTQ